MEANGARQEILDIKDAVLQNKIHQLELVKTIYPSKVKKTSRDIEKIMGLAIQTHLDKNPDLKFKQIGKPIKNDDQSHTYIIQFERKILK